MVDLQQGNSKDFASLHSMALQRLPYRYACNCIKAYNKCCGKKYAKDQKQVHVCALGRALIPHELS